MTVRGEEATVERDEALPLLRSWRPDPAGMDADGQFERVLLQVPESELDDLRRRLRSTRWSPDIGGEGWHYGVPGRVLRDLVQYWLDGYDWRAQEAQINTLSHYRAEIGEVSVHFALVRSGKADSVPLIMTHGWPWTFWDFHRLAGQLSAEGAPHFDLVIPSLPGFAFSSITGSGPVGAQRTGDIWHELMSRLGYSRYGAVGCDWGAYVSANMAHAHAPPLLGVYLTLCAIPGFDPARLRAADYGADEQGWWERWSRGYERARAHVLYNKHFPQTQGWALTDSPSGLAAMLIGHRKDWSDPDHDFVEVFGMDFLLTTVCLYWFTRTAASAARFYADSLREPWRRRSEGGVSLKAPIGVGTFPYEPVLVPRDVMAMNANLTHWSVFDRGGHFAPMEAPSVLATDIRRFFAGATAIS